jgi:hypothetical protein
MVWIVIRRPKSPLQNLEKAFTSREKLINGQKRGLKAFILGFISSASDGPVNEAFEISR